ncbi:MAG: hypothetical protein GEV05_14505 [Betaproteobacteria bacterium]|nr:hypothetical protein [Betaproteobacteria bacterium]
MALIYNPTASSYHAPKNGRLKVSALAGQTIGFIDNAKPNFNALVDDLAELLVARYGVAGVIKRAKRGAAMPAPELVVNELAEKCVLVITGSGD